MKLCIDCKHFKRDWLYYLGHGDRFSKCVRPEGISLVNGKPCIKIKFADLERNYDYNCGEEAKYFEEKK